MKIDTMSRNVIRIMRLLSKNDSLVKLLANNQLNPLQCVLPEDCAKNILNPKSEQAKILPYPFDVDAKTKDGSFIRVYYNRGQFDAGDVIADCDLHIDIIVAKSLWLMYCEIKDESLIRPYEIMERVVDLLGRKGIGDVRLDIEGYQHHYINTKFDSIRLYCNYTSIETLKKDSR